MSPDEEFDPDNKIYLSWCKAVLVRELDQNKCIQLTDGENGYERWQGPSRWFNLMFEQEKGWLKVQMVGAGEYTVYVRGMPDPLFSYSNYSQCVQFIHTTFEAWLAALLRRVL